MGSERGEGDAGRGVSSDGGGRLAATEGERGSRSVCSFMLYTIFSSTRGVICFSLPLLRLRAESSSGVVKPEQDSVSVCSSEVADSTLDESDGTSFRLGRCFDISIAGVVESWGWASQQSVSRAHSRQLRFSNRFPPSIDSAHLEKTDPHSQ